MTVPEHRHKKIDGKILLYFWTDECGVRGNKYYEFLIDVKKRLRKEFNLEVAFVLPSRMSKKDPRVEKLTYATPAWFYWNMEENVTFSEWKNKVTSFCTNGRRHPISSIWKTDWDPETNTGTRVDEDKHPADGYYRPAHRNGKSVYEEGLIEANKRKALWMVLESWGNTFEGSTWFRSDNKDYKYPSEFIYITRKYADKDSASLLLQAECYDAHRDKSPGNDGKVYRFNWTTDKEPDVDLYRPLHRINGFIPSELNQKISELSAGANDVWVLNNKSKTFANEVDGNARWKPAKTNGKKFSRFALGKGIGWAICQGQLYWTWFPEGWGYANSGDWQEVENASKIREIATNKLRNALYAVDHSGNLWRKRKDAKATQPLEQVNSPLLKCIAVGEHFIWGVTGDSQLVRRHLDSTEPWRSYKIESRIRNISAGSGEIWLTTYQGDVYRMPEHGGDYLEFVTSGTKDVSLGTGFVWLAKKDGTLAYSRLEGFVSKNMEKALPLQ